MPQNPIETARRWPYFPAAMLEDRDYMREQPRYEEPGMLARLPLALWLVILNAVVFAAQLIVPMTAPAGSLRPPTLEEHLALTPGDLLAGQVWQLLSFQFLHGGFLHLLINCAMLYIFGRPVEHALGRTHFLKLYFGSGALGGLVQIAAMLAFPRHFGGGAVVGASAGVFGLIAAFATLHREMPITMLVAFILPVTMRAKYLLLVEVILACLGLLDANSHIAHAAHLGGMVGGVLYVQALVKWRWRMPWSRLGQEAPPERELVGARARQGAGGRGAQPPPAEQLSTQEFLEREVDPILEKISAHGIQSLTERERRILEAARNRIASR